jgi:hypothetical protein
VACGMRGVLASMPRHCLAAACARALPRVTVLLFPTRIWADWSCADRPAVLMLVGAGAVLACAGGAESIPAMPAAAVTLCGAGARMQRLAQQQVQPCQPCTPCNDGVGVEVAKFQRSLQVSDGVMYVQRGLRLWRVCRRCTFELGWCTCSLSVSICMCVSFFSLPGCGCICAIVV